MVLPLRKVRARQDTVVGNAHPSLTASHPLAARESATEITPPMAGLAARWGRIRQGCNGGVRAHRAVGDNSGTANPTACKTKQRALRALSEPCTRVGCLRRGATRVPEKWSPAFAGARGQPPSKDPTSEPRTRQNSAYRRISVERGPWVNPEARGLFCKSPWRQPGVEESCKATQVMAPRDARDGALRRFGGRADFNPWLPPGALAMRYTTQVGSRVSSSESGRA
jgi:hypothetical protein